MKDNKLFGWIKPKEEQLSWLINYLSQRIPTSTVPSPPYEEKTIEVIIKDICQAKTGDSLILFMAKTRSAWNQKKRRTSRKVNFVTSTLEMKTDVYKEAVRIAKKYNIPTNVAIEELVKKGCELESEYMKEESLRKQVTSLKSDIYKKRQTRLSELNINEKKLISTEDIHKKLTLEMFDKHCLELQLINLANDKDSTLIKDEISKEKERYINDCKKYGIDCISSD